MAINDVSLTSGMKSNLLSLQGTVSLLYRTQERLSTGKKVNTALDNPVSFFTAQELNSRAGIIDGLKDAMGQAVQTITAADKGIKAINSMIEQAKGIAQAALSAPPGTASGDENTFNITFSRNFNEFEYLYVGNATTYKATSVKSEICETFAIGASVSETVANLAAAINDFETNKISYVPTAKFAATASGNTLSVTKTVVATGKTAPIDYNTGSYEVSIGGGINTYPIGSVETSRGPLKTGGAELVLLQEQYNTLRNQLDALAKDAGYKGKNLLNADTMTVKFEGAALNVAGFDASATGLGIGAATWVSGGSIDNDINALNNALVTLRTKSSEMSGNLSIINIRQDFSTNMIDTLNAGADKLTLADTNEEGAHMLMLQTRQSLSTTALSLSAQAAQSVLQLFR